jgi:hypothetical protein
VDYKTLPASSISSLKDFHDVFYSHCKIIYPTERLFENCCERYASYIRVSTSDSSSSTYEGDDWSEYEDEDSLLDISLSRSIIQQEDSQQFDFEIPNNDSLDEEDDNVEVEDDLLSSVSFPNVLQHEDFQNSDIDNEALDAFGINPNVFNSGDSDIEVVPNLFEDYIADDYTQKTSSLSLGFHYTPAPLYDCNTLFPPVCKYNWTGQGLWQTHKYEYVM